MAEVRTVTRTAVVTRDAGSDVVVVMPGVWPSKAASPDASQPPLGQVQYWRRLVQRLRNRLAGRAPAIRRALPRDLAILLILFSITRMVGLGWIMTDSVHRSAVLVLKGAPVRPGELAVFGYQGEPIAGYYEADAWSQLMSAFGVAHRSAGPRKGEGFVKYLVGVPGDRIEVEDRHVWLVTARGRIDGGLCKTHSRHGVPLEPIAPQVIPAGYVYMWAPHVDALDSRYATMGLVPISAIAGRGVPLW